MTVVPRPRAHRLLAGMFALALLTAACGDDDGDSVRESGPGASGSPSAPGSGSPSAPASGSPSAP